MDFKKFRESLAKDPLLSEYYRYQNECISAGKEIVLRTPLDALAEKKLYLFALLSFETVKVKLLYETKTYKSILDIRYAMVQQIIPSTVIFFEKETWNLCQNLRKKVNEAYSLCEKDKLPKTKSLPFDAIWITTPGGVTTIDNVSVDAGLLYRDPKSDHWFNFGFCFTDGALQIAAGEWKNQSEIDALAIFLEEKIITIEKVKPTRAFRKQIKKLNLNELETVSVLTLRTKEISKTEKSSTLGDSKKEFFHQWLVRGHIRNQWFASKNQHELIWIDPYKKGPEDKPFKETVRHVKF